jgi:hypothetical protein
MEADTLLSYLRNFSFICVYVSNCNDPEDIQLFVKIQCIDLTFLFIRCHALASAYFLAGDQWARLPFYNHL